MFWRLYRRPLDSDRFLIILKPVWLFETFLTPPTLECKFKKHVIVNLDGTDTWLRFFSAWCDQVKPRKTFKEIGDVPKVPEVANPRVPVVMGSYKEKISTDMWAARHPCFFDSSGSYYIIPANILEIIAIWEKNPQYFMELEWVLKIFELFSSELRVYSGFRMAWGLSRRGPSWACQIMFDPSHTAFNSPRFVHHAWMSRWEWCFFPWAVHTLQLHLLERSRKKGRGCKVQHRS